MEPVYLSCPQADLHKPGNVQLKPLGISREHTCVPGYEPTYFRALVVIENRNILLTELHSVPQCGLLQWMFLSLELNTVRE
jgi:hypothetical protein